MMRQLAFFAVAMLCVVAFWVFCGFVGYLSAGCARGDLHLHLYERHTHEAQGTNDVSDELENDPRWEALDDAETTD